MTIDQLCSPRVGAVARGAAIDVRALEVRAGDRLLVDRVTLSVEAGAVLAIAGASGAGKSTLLEAVAGLRPSSRGSVSFPTVGGGATGSVTIGFVPQDDIIHKELPLRTSLRYAARLRLRGTWTDDAVEALVHGTLARLELLTVADVRVGSLSGGQRKRASIATELLARPDVLLLDEPTSGLDPATAAEVIGTLHALADEGTTVVFTTHGLADLDRADRIAFLAPGGRLAFHGTPAAARAFVESADLAALYAPPIGRGDRPRPVAPAPPRGRRTTRPVRPDTAGPWRQWRVLTRRTVALLTGNRLTMAIMFGSPVLVVTMMVVLFPAGAAAEPAVHPLTAIQTMFWVSFAAFFFGLTAGLLQIVPEAAIARRERLAGVRPSVYVASKVTALAPVLVLVVVGMLEVLHVTDRLPTTGGASPLALIAVVLLESMSALAIGLLASALVRDASQATLALPMLCFPQVLFAGAVIGVGDMARAGQVVSVAMATRWGFDGIGRSLEVGSSIDFGGELAPYRPAITGSVVDVAFVLGGITLVVLAATVVAVRQRTR